MAEPSIRSWSLSKCFARKLAVDGLTLAIPAGQAFGLLGPNGAGKSTLVKMLLGLVKPTSGWCEVNGAPPTHAPSRRQVGYLPELFRFPQWLTARELLRYHGRLIGMSGEVLEAEIARALKAGGISDAADRKVGGYSKGMQQRAGIAQAILGRPNIVFLDEPTSALDPVGRVEVRDLIGELVVNGTTVFLNSHLLTDVEKICSTVAVMRQGRIIESAATVDLTTGLRLEIEVDHVPEGLCDHIAAHWGAVSSLNGKPQFSVKISSRDAIPEIAELLTSKGLKIYRLQPATTTLEEAFLDLLDGSSAGEDIGGGAGSG